MFLDVVEFVTHNFGDVAYNHVYKHAGFEEGCTRLCNQ